MRRIFLTSQSSLCCLSLSHGHLWGLLCIVTHIQVSGAGGGWLSWSVVSDQSLGGHGGLLVSSQVSPLVESRVFY